VTQTTTTGTGGTYRFCGLPPGTYTVAEVLQPLWVQTFPPTPGTHTVTLAANQVVTGRNFGNRRVIAFPDFVVRNLTAIPPGIPGGNVALGSQVLVRFDIVNQGTRRGRSGPSRNPTDRWWRTHSRSECSAGHRDDRTTGRRRFSIFQSACDDSARRAHGAGPDSGHRRCAKWN
jgi:hypothetical protein